MKEELSTAWFSFGQIHIHAMNGKTFDKDCIVEITAKEPRAVMFETFGSKWAMQYDEPPDMKNFQRGIIKL